MANEGVMRNAIRRYESFWLPLLTTHGGEAGGLLLAAPLDVAWAWWAHALCPLEYRKVGMQTTTPEHRGHLVELLAEEVSDMSPLRWRKWSHLLATLATLHEWTRMGSPIRE